MTPPPPTLSCPWCPRARALDKLCAVFNDLSLASATADDLEWLARQADRGGAP